MNVARTSVHNHGSEGFAVNVEPAGKAVEALPGEAAHTPAEAGEQHKPEQNRAEKRVDAWMEDIRKFIRNIDVKSL